MVSYFVPRGHFFMKARNLRQTYQKQQSHQGWPVLRHFRQSFSVQKVNGSQLPNNEHNAKVNNLIRRGVVGKTTYGNEKIDKQTSLQNQRQSVWTKWTRLLLRLAPVGICVFGAIEWQLHKRKCADNNLPRTASNLQTKIYCSLPLRLISRCWGWLAACYVPVSLRPYIYGWYSSAFHVNMDEALHPDFKYYNSLSEFFTRALREGVRPIDQNAPLVSPADGKILHFGSAADSLIEQVKGVNYSVETFLGPATWLNASTKKEYVEAIKQKGKDSALYQCVIYLAPGDYHRFHSPADWKPTQRRHFDGELLSVNPTIASWLPGIFCLNERATYLGSWKYGFFSYTAVGATNVGSVHIYMDENLRTNRWVGFHVGSHKSTCEFQEMQLAKDMGLGKGELVGHFNMGSTIVLLFEAPKNFKFNIEAGQKIRVGEAIGYVNN